MKKNITRVLLWILCIGSLTAMSSHASPVASAEIPLLNHPHPRLLLFKGEEEGIKQMIASHPEWQKMHNLILRECDVLLQGPDLERKLQGANMLKVSREMWKRAFYLSYAYRMTGDKRYARKVERDMLSVCRFSDWNPQHCLDGAEMTRGVAFGYDWFYDELSESSRCPGSRPNPPAACRNGLHLQHRHTENTNFALTSRRARPTVDSRSIRSGNR